jgi:hypothetical protein
MKFVDAAKDAAQAMSLVDRSVSGLTSASPKDMADGLEPLSEAALHMARATRKLLTRVLKTTNGDNPKANEKVADYAEAMVKHLGDASNELFMACNEIGCAGSVAASLSRSNDGRDFTF